MRGELRRALVAVCSAITARDVCQVLAGAIVRPSTVLVRFWLRDDDHLRLQASAGFPTGGGAYNRVDGEFSRIAVGHGKIGQIAATGEPLIVRGVRGDEDWLANPGWISRQGVRAFVALPLVASGQVVGVMATFDRVIPNDEAVDELRFITDVAAARISELASRAAPVAMETATIAPAAPAPAAPIPPSPPVPPAAAVITRAEARAREKANIEAALAITHGKIFGADGAAMLLGMRPTTLASRIKTLGVTRDRG